MKNLKKSIVFMAIVCMTILLIPFSVNAKEDQFRYRVRNSKVTITGINKPAKKVIFPEKIDGKKVTEISLFDWENGETIDELVIPKYVKKLNIQFKSSVFSNAESNGPAKYTVVKGNKYFSSEKGMILDKSGKKLLYCPQGMYGKVVVPNGVTEIADNAFSGCNEITQVVLPKSVKKIGEKAFLNCQDLQKINLPSKIKTIDAYAFQNCRFLKSITIPKRVTKLEGTFAGCVRLKDVKFAKGSAISDIGNATFFNCLQLKKIVLPSKVKTIGDYAFLECRYMKEINLSSKTTSIGKMAFGKLINDADEKLDYRNPDFITNPLDESTDLKGITINAPLNSYAYKYAKERESIGFKAVVK